MRPPVDMAAVAILRELPEFSDQIGDLVDLYGEDLTPEVVLVELADYVAALVAAGDQEDAVGACCAALEAIVEQVEDGDYLVSCPFMAALPEQCLATCREYFGPRLEEIAQRVAAEYAE